VGGKLNVSYNCLDRTSTPRDGRRRRLIWEGEPGDTRTLTYWDLYREVNRFASALKRAGVKRGDRVTIYMPMVPETAIAMLACTRIGAPHSVIFGGFAPDAIRERIHDAQSTVLLTGDGGWRRGGIVPLKKNVDEALQDCPDVKTVVVLKRTGQPIDMQAGRDVWWEDFVKGADAYCAPEKMDAEDMLYLLYTSGSTGKPKGIQHTTGGYLTGVYATTKWVFDLKDTDVYWCTGRHRLGHRPFLRGVRPSRQRHHHRHVRGYAGHAGQGPLLAHHREARHHHLLHRPHGHPHLHALGRPLSRPLRPLDASAPRLGRRAHQSRSVGLVLEGHRGRSLPGGGHVVADRDGTHPHHPAARSHRPSSRARRPSPSRVSRPRCSTTRASPAKAGYPRHHEALAGHASGIYRDPQRFQAQYWSRYPGIYFTGDGAKLDDDGYFWLLGRVDDVMNISGHRVSTMEVESALVDHPLVAEAAVIGRPHEIKGQAIAAFVTIRDGNQGSKELMEELKGHVTKKIGALARPDDLIFASDLPKTRSGKIMRRLLRDIAEGKALGDTTTLADPAGGGHAQGQVRRGGVTGLMTWSSWLCS
jgi:acetyl-CoA synthetase